MKTWDTLFQTFIHDQFVLHDSYACHALLNTLPVNKEPNDQPWRLQITCQSQNLKNTFIVWSNRRNRSYDASNGKHSFLKFKSMLLKRHSRIPCSSSFYLYYFTHHLMSGKHSLPYETNLSWINVLGIISQAYLVHVHFVQQIFRPFKIRSFSSRHKGHVLGLYSSSELWVPHVNV